MIHEWSKFTECINFKVVVVHISMRKKIYCIIVWVGKFNTYRSLFWLFHDHQKYLRRCYRSFSKWKNSTWRVLEKSSLLLHEIRYINFSFCNRLFGEVFFWHFSFILRKVFLFDSHNQLMEKCVTVILSKEDVRHIPNDWVDYEK